ncbi:hypothetical protein [Aquimarina litoralis]|uniref:hypothetical protein n=1 Tax=Aquimarina litoralis TaxID=584605 RepID=UPI001C57D590|nr:hypothetical protein [Aquimarina litoralis]MBW1298879.1 hypothetical protein [Aquimarina litoralis]
MKFRKTHIISTMLFVLICTGCSKNAHKLKPVSTNSPIEKESVSKLDTLHVGYTYWWPQTGPFIGNCGERYSLVFLGIVDQVYEKKKEEHYVSQKGVIKISDVLYATSLAKDTFKEENYFVSDCFAQSDITKGDKVVVFCYEYEGKFSNPGGKSILKIKDYNSPIVKSVEEYIKSDQNPLAIKEDVSLWKQHQLDTSLKQLISCKELH